MGQARNDEKEGKDRGAETRDGEKEALWAKETVRKKHWKATRSSPGRFPPPGQPDPDGDYQLSSPPSPRQRFDDKNNLSVAKDTHDGMMDW